MTRKLITLISFITTLTVYGQNAIENKLTDAHQDIKQTKISLIPPTGFSVGQDFIGFQQNDFDSRIMVLDFPEPYSMTSEVITNQILTNKDIEVKKIEDITINGLQAVLITMIQKNGNNIYAKFVLILGTKEESVVLIGVSPSNLKEISAEIRKSILTVFYDENRTLDPFASLNYAIDVKGTKLKFAKKTSDSRLFNVDGKIPTGSTDKTFLTVAQIFSSVVEKDKKLLSINLTKQLPYEIEKIEYTNEIKIGGLSGYETFARVKKTKTEDPECIYQVILFNDTLYNMCFLGMTNDKTDKSIDDIKKAILTFKQK